MSIKNKITTTVNEFTDSLKSKITWKQSAKDLANNLITRVWTDEVDKIATQEEQDECKTLQEAAKNPIFIKGLAVAMEDIAPEYDWILKSKDFWEKDFFPKFFANNNDIVKLIIHSNHYTRAYNFLNNIHQDHSKSKLKKLDRYLNLIFKEAKNDSSKNVESIFRDSFWRLNASELIHRMIRLFNIKNQEEQKKKDEDNNLEQNDHNEHWSIAPNAD